MPALSFPASPTVGQTSTQNGREYRYAGNNTWELVAASAPDSRWDLFLPAAPTGLTATGGNAQASLSWTAPTGVIAQAPITDYREQYSTDNGSTWTNFTGAAASTATSAIVTGLSNGTAYRFRVAGINGIGTGAFSSTSEAVTPTAPPSGSLSILRNTNPSNGDHYVAGAGTLASPYFYQRGAIDLGGEPPVFRVVGTLNITFVFPDTVKIYKGTNPVTESIVSFVDDPRINTLNQQTVAAVGGTVIASGRNTTVTVSVTDRYLKVRTSADPWVWFPAADNPEGTENIYPSVRIYVS